MLTLLKYVRIPPVAEKLEEKEDRVEPDFRRARFCRVYIKIDENVHKASSIKSLGPPFFRPAKLLRFGLLDLIEYPVCYGGDEIFLTMIA